MIEGVHQAVGRNRVEVDVELVDLGGLVDEEWLTGRAEECEGDERSDPVVHAHFKANVVPRATPVGP